MKYLEVKSMQVAPENKALRGPPQNKATDFDATDAAVELANESGLDLSKLKGTGVDGRITKGDVQTFLDAGKA